jgi:hypothetical protein
VAGLAAVVVIAALPGFFILHRTSLNGPPLTAMVLLMLAVMVHAPRFSIAYGSIAAVAAVMIAPEALGLPLAALIWALMQPWRSGWPGWRRALLAVAPVAVLVLLTGLVGHAWHGAGPVAWAGGLDRGLRAAGHLIGDHLAPTIDSQALRWFAIADLTLIAIAVVVVAWRRVQHSYSPGTPLRRLYPAVAVLWLGMGCGLVIRQLFMPKATEPGLVAIFPLIAISVVVLTVSVAVLWRHWHRWAKFAAILIIMGWLQAAIRA